MSCLDRQPQIRRVFRMLDILKCMHYGLTSKEMHREMPDWTHRTIMRDLALLLEIGRVIKKGKKYHATKDEKVEGRAYKVLSR
jgi:hypothetical protein